jgi:hypothetical protein
MRRQMLGEPPRFTQTPFPLARFADAPAHMLTEPPGSLRLPPLVRFADKTLRVWEETKARRGLGDR